MVDQMPTEVGRFIIEGLLGSGDFADTLLARDGDNPVAVKLARLPTGDGAERLRDESRILQTLSHDAIPAAIASGAHDGCPYLAMSLAPGFSLRDVWRSNLQRNGRLSDLDAMQLAVILFSVLTYLHECIRPDGGTGWVHRDIKDANVLATADFEKVTLIDFGFCKEAGASDRRLDDSFFRAGAARYSPPSKLEYPSRALATHDIFAVGVLLYQLLTNEFPWSAGQGSLGNLSAAMKNASASRVSDLNSVVSRRVSDFVHTLIEVRDAYRPTARTAMDEAIAIRDQISSGISVSTPASRPITFDAVWRDAVLGDIRLTRFEREVIDTPEMQRLREIKQLGLAYFAYDGARHSRLGHSIGCVQKAEDVLHAIEMIEGVRIDNEFRQVARLYALTHDVTHTTLGHTLEDEYGFFARHDLNAARTNRIVLGEDSKLNEVLRSSSLGREVLAQFAPGKKQEERAAIEDLVAGPVGVDVLDYVDRDAYFCGVDHRVDSAFMRQLRMSSPLGTHETHIVSSVQGRYGLRADREYAVESLYAERYALFLKIYTHKAKLRASALVAKALALALYGGKRAVFSESELEGFSDAELLSRLAGCKRGNAKELIAALGRRQLPKAVYRGSLMREADLAPGYNQVYSRRVDDLQGDGSLGLFPFAKRAQVENVLAQAAGLRSDQVFVYATPTAPGLKRTQEHRFLVDADGHTREPTRRWFEDIQTRHMLLWDVWVFAEPSVGSRAEQLLRDAAHGRFGLENRIDVPPRNDALF